MNVGQTSEILQDMLGGTGAIQSQSIAAVIPSDMGQPTGIVWVSEDERALEMFERFASRKFTKVIGEQWIRLSITAWAIRNKMLGGMKRILDLVICVMAIPFVAPIMLITAIAIKFD